MIIFINHSLCGGYFSSSQYATSELNMVLPLVDDPNLAFHGVGFILLVKILVGLPF
jgi:hypothetical protein